MKLVVGLGNPGKEYANTRHNIGFMVIDAYLGEVTWSKKFNGLYYEKVINGERYLFLKPQTYMNLSGSCVSSFINYFKIDIKDLLVIHDDLDLDVARFRIKINSSAGGHNGIKDIINALKTNSFARLKIGISSNKLIDTKDYVLGAFRKEEIDNIKEHYNSFFDIIENFDYNRINDLMNKYN